MVFGVEGGDVCETNLEEYYWGETTAGAGTSTTTRYGATRRISALGSRVGWRSPSPGPRSALAPRERGRQRSAAGDLCRTGHSPRPPASDTDSLPAAAVIRASAASRPSHRLACRTWPVLWLRPFAHTSTVWLARRRARATSPDCRPLRRTRRYRTPRSPSSDADSSHPPRGT